MVRKLAKSTPGSASRSSSKRAAPEKQTPSRQSKRAKVTAAKYAELDSDDASEETQDVKASDFEADSSKEPTSESGDEEASEEASDDDVKPKKGNPRGRPTQRALPIHKKQADDKELWKSGAKLPPGTQLIMKKPKARDAGQTPYTDDTIHPNTMLFLKDLAANNERQWLKYYRASLQDFTTFLEQLSEKVSTIDETIPELPVKDLIFRIYRDVRFSKSQIPYKTHFSAAFSRTGRKGPYAAYYVQIQPGGESFVGGGLWQPEAQPLSLLRRDIDRKPHKIKRVLIDERLRKAFFGGIDADEKKAVKAFANQPSNRSTALKRHPKGYDQDHKDIELLKLKSFTVGTKLSDSEVLGAAGLDRISGLIASMVPFITYLNNVVMPDEEPSDSSEEEEEEGDGSEADGGDGDET